MPATPTHTLTVETLRDGTYSAPADVREDTYTTALDAAGIRRAVLAEFERESNALRAAIRRTGGHTRAARYERRLAMLEDDRAGFDERTRDAESGGEILDGAGYGVGFPSGRILSVAPRAAEMTTAGLLEIGRACAGRDLEDLRRVAPGFDGEHGLLVAALESVWGAGGADDETGATDERGHAFRVARWIVETDTSGNIDVSEAATEEIARERFEDVRGYLEPDAETEPLDDTDPGARDEPDPIARLQWVAEDLASWESSSAHFDAREIRLAIADILAESPGCVRAAHADLTDPDA